MGDTKAKDKTEAASSNIAEMNADSLPNSKEENGEDATNKGPYTRAARRLKTFANGEQVEQEEEFQELKEAPKQKKATALSNTSDQRRIQVGRMFQAPTVEVLDKALAEKDIDRDVPIWLNNSEEVNETKLDQYIDEAVGVYRLSLDRALFILYNSGYDFNLARAEVQTRKVVEEDWNDDDKILFRLAFQQYGKNFNKIKQIMPYRSVSNIIQHYYQVKKRWKDDSHVQTLESVEIMNTQANNEVSRTGKYIDNVETRCNKKKKFYNAFEPLPSIEQLTENSFEGICENCGQKSKQIQLTDTERVIYITGENEKELYMCLLCRQYLEKRGELRPSDLVPAIKEVIRKQYCSIDEDWKIMLDDFVNQCSLVMDSDIPEFKNNEKTQMSVKNNCVTVLDLEFKELKHRITHKAGQTQGLEDQLESAVSKVPDFEHIRQRAKDFKIKEKNIRRGKDGYGSPEKFIALQAMARYNLNWDIIMDIIPNKSREQLIELYKNNMEIVDEIRHNFENGGPLFRPMIIDQDMPKLEAVDMSKPA